MDSEVRDPKLGAKEKPNWTNECDRSPNHPGFGGRFAYECA